MDVHQQSSSLCLFAQEKKRFLHKNIKLSSYRIKKQSQEWGEIISLNIVY